ncbi:restriction endonuclease subunit S [uncultured Zoogloea sp.]|jgi:type I restriction enzyme S subunit|uniref:restriction endonuclease subunit S n=1 Tax=uncultured Zoogloea sp. TaxID=160237 RepID=UPI00263345BA|nr:restriction endonuclease subunit S [uncultured Zoogloea sp.]
MSLPCYPKYKSSGGQWLAHVPEHWDVIPCRAFVDEQTAKNEGAENQYYLSLISNVGVIPYEEKGDVGNKKPDDLSKCKLVCRGDFVINSMNYGIGSYGLSPYDGVCSPVYIVLRPRLHRVEPRYAFRIFENKEFQTYAQSFGNGILEHRASINWDNLKSIHVGIPPLPEQKLILKFLDHETEKIDALIAEQETLLRLLAEKRQATISHAVTKGLNPDAPMKDSGVAWLGEVPEHWVLLRIKHLVASLEQGWSPQCEGFPVQSEDEWGVLKVGCVNGGIFRPEENKTLPRELEPLPELGLASGDLLISRANTRELVGSAAVALRSYPRLMLCDKLYRLRLRTDACSPQFLASYLGTPQVRGQIELAATGASSSMLNIGQSTIRELSVVVPPRHEQTAIISFLDTETAKLDSLKLESERAIALLKERRAALISAAVTGQIDVRHEAA